MASGLLEMLNSPAGIGLLSAIAGGAAGARRGQPINSIGRGLVTGIGGYQDARQQIRADEENVFAKKYKSLQMQEIESKMAKDAAQKTWRAGLPGVMAPQLTGVTDQSRQLAAQQEPFGPEAFPALLESAEYADPNAPLNMYYGVNQPAVDEYLRRPESPFADELNKRQMLPEIEKSQLVTVYGADGVPMQKWVRPGESTGTDVGRGKPEAGGGYKERKISLDGQTYISQSSNDGGKTWGQIEGSKPYDIRASSGSSDTRVSVGGSTIINEAAREKMGGKMGADIGEQAAAVEGKWSAIDSVRDAKKMLSKGIYTGSWADVQMSIAKRTSGALGDRGIASNTEAYLAHIGNTVIPRLKEFGGNDSNEEMRYLKSVMGGDISMEPEALANVLDAVEIKIMRGIERLQRQQGTIEGGGVPDLGGGPGRNAKPKPAPKQGEVRNGYKYFGGDPSSPKSWVKVKQ